MEMKKCKECGKLFMPKSARVQYCSDIHYRPCPVCGKKVEAKYLSDPPRCCSKECQQILRNKSATHKPKCVTPAPTSVHVEPKLVVTPPKLVAGPQKVEELYGEYCFGAGDENAEMEALFDYEDAIRQHYVCATYIRKKAMHFEPGHEYALDILKKKDKPYAVHAVYDFRLSKRVDLRMSLSSWISVNQNFTRAEVIMNDSGKLEVIGDGPIYSAS